MIVAEFLGLKPKIRSKGARIGINPKRLLKHYITWAQAWIVIGRSKISKKIIRHINQPKQSSQSWFNHNIIIILILFIIFITFITLYMKIIQMRDDS